ncbi:hypothetical protein PDE_06493 [Penicillium oxalicum 114-2]|uniref:Uncharacterized protein n=1 Tax=Penicillium oxalicum (strain 114-2 / CGMCC 5302) TaxID=933388 RepID=S8AYQ1_PENO1|nr:hypothetical protein PDE_06493 [Penicillium oxalicum 114-2]
MELGRLRYGQWEMGGGGAMDAQDEESTLKKGKKKGEKYKGEDKRERYVGEKKLSICLNRGPHADGERVEKDEADGHAKDMQE